MVDVVGFEPTAFRLRAEYSDPVELHIHKKLYLILSTNYNHLTTLYPRVNNLLKKLYLRLFCKSKSLYTTNVLSFDLDFHTGKALIILFTITEYKLLRFCSAA